MPKTATKPKQSRPAKSGPMVHSDGNGRVVMTGAAFEDTVPTADPHDRAHLLRDPTDPMNRLRPAARRGRPTIDAKPRRYPPCYMVGSESGPVSFETALEDSYRREQWLKTELGLDLTGGHTTSSWMAAAFEGAVGDDIRLRDILHQKTRTAPMGWTRCGGGEKWI